MPQARVHSGLMAGAILVVMLATSNAAHAFYWRDWPGSGTTSTASTTSSSRQSSTAQTTTTQPVVTQMATTPATTTSNSGDEEKTDPDPEDPDPDVDPVVDPLGGHLPEPSSLLAGLLGLGALGIVRRSRQVRI